MLPQALDVMTGWRNPDEINNRIGGTIALEVLLVLAGPHFQRWAPTPHPMDRSRPRVVGVHPPSIAAD